MQHIFRFFDAELGIDRHHDRAEARQREQQHDMAIAVTRHHAHTVAFANAARRQHPRGGIDLVRELAPRPGTVAVSHERTSGITAGAARQRAVQAVVVFSIQTDNFQRFFHVFAGTE